jgi:predicted transcriptional regulator
MGKMEHLEPFWQFKFLLTLSDGRSKGVTEIAIKMRVHVDPTTYMFVEKIAEPLSKRGLIKSTWGGYKITDAGLAWLQREGLELVMKQWGRPDWQIEYLAQLPLKELRRLFDM